MTVTSLTTRPQHGKLTPRRVTAVARQNRFSTYGAACLGKSMPGFEVDYTSTPGYRGTDSFAIEVIYGNRNPILERPQAPLLAVPCVGHNESRSPEFVPALK